MDGELLTRLTIWLAIVAYTGGSVIFAASRGRWRWDSAARAAWTIACASLIVHSICAFQFYHSWSHEAAYRETARQTEAVTGLNWGGGLFINYLVLIVWLVDLGWWWLRGLNSYRERPWQLIAAWHGFLLFIIFNSTVVFKDGPVRWVGLVMSLVLLGCFVSFVIFQMNHQKHEAPEL
jgi:hypothetical protein